MDRATLMRHPAVWLAVAVEVAVQALAAVLLDGWAQGLAIAIAFGLFAGFLAWLAGRGPKAPSTSKAARHS